MYNNLDTTRCPFISGEVSMSIESYKLIEHFDYMCKYVPQPFYINSEDVIELTKSGDDGEDYSIKTNRMTYSLNKSSIKKLVDSLGVKIKLLSAVADEADVIDLVLPAVNKLFKCFSDCFVFYANSEDATSIIDLNVNSDHGAEGTKYANGPSPWKVDIRKNPSVFTCFVDFMNRYCIDKDEDTDILVKADELMPSNSGVSINLFKEIKDNRLQPMLMFSGKFSNMNGFSDIRPVLWDSVTDIPIVFPMNYAKLEGASFEDMWKKVIHTLESTDLDDYIFREVNELAASSETPSVVKNFITNVIIDNPLNINQPIKDILTEAVTCMTQLKPSKARKFKKDLGAMIAFALCMKHAGCEHCGHMELH